jgi:hypothetical protein
LRSPGTREPLWSHSPRVQKPPAPVALSWPRRYGIEVAAGLHHHRFLDQAIVRVLITTLWQTGYTVKKCPPFGRPSLTNAKEREQYSNAPSAPASGWGKSHAGSGSWGDEPYSARGRCHSDTFTYANSQSGDVGKLKATRSLDPISGALAVARCVSYIISANSTLTLLRSTGVGSGWEAVIRRSHGEQKVVPGADLSVARPGTGNSTQDPSLPIQARRISPILT